MPDDIVAGVERMTTLPSPLLEEGAVTTLVGPLGLELAALTCAIACSYQSGREVVPGWEPKGLGKVMAYSYSSDWAAWRGLLSDVSPRRPAVGSPLLKRERGYENAQTCTPEFESA